MIAERFARGIGAGVIDLGPMPSAGLPGTLSGAPVFGPQGLELVPSRGEKVWATFRLIYLTNPWVHAAVNLIAGTVARMPVCVYATDPETGDPVLQRDDYPVTPGRMTGGQWLDRLFDRPAGWISRQSLIRSTLIDRLALGNGLWEILPGTGLPSGLKKIPWRAVRNLITGADGLPAVYHVAKSFAPGRINANETRNLAPIDVVHFGRGADPDLGIGVSPLASCRNTLRLHDAVMRSLIAWFTNAMQPAGHVTVDKLTREKAREIREMIVEAYASPENAGKVLVTSGKWEKTQELPANSEVVQLLQESRQEVLAAYGIPELVLGILAGSRSAGNAVTTIRSQYIRDTVGTWTDDLEGDIAAQLLPAAPSWQQLTVKLNMAEQLRPDFEVLAQALNELGDTLSVDQKLEFLGLPPFRKPWSRVPWSKPGSQPLDEAAAGGPAPSTPLPAEQARRNGHVPSATEDLEEALT